ncbi:hypothetical protein BGY98DRAFT_924631, partial [Russula aff. rugulosa BPL654]
PISILVITDGVPTDDPRSVIVEIARRLDIRGVPLRQLNIQFAQTGDDANAAKALKELDGQLGPDHGVHVNTVDTTPFSQAEPSLRADFIIKIVLGAINSAIDHGKARHLCFFNLLEEWLLSKGDQCGRIACHISIGMLWICFWKYVSPCIFQTSDARVSRSVRTPYQYQLAPE